MCYRRAEDAQHIEQDAAADKAAPAEEAQQRRQSEMTEMTSATAIKSADAVATAVTEELPAVDIQQSLIKTSSVGTDCSGFYPYTVGAACAQ